LLLDSVVYLIFVEYHEFQGIMDFREFLVVKFERKRPYRDLRVGRLEGNIKINLEDMTRPGLNPGRRSGKPATIIFFIIIWFVRLLALRPLLAYCASLG
jgi:hypothetical protein